MYRWVSVGLYVVQASPWPAVCATIRSTVHVGRCSVPSSRFHALSPSALGYDAGDGSIRSFSPIRCQRQRCSGVHAAAQGKWNTALKWRMLLLTVLLLLMMMFVLVVMMQ
jgi:hypothetical protein